MVPSLGCMLESPGDMKKKTKNKKTMGPSPEVLINCSGLWPGPGGIFRTLHVIPVGATN